MRRGFTPPGSTSLDHTTAQVERRCRGLGSGATRGYVWRSLWQLRRVGIVIPAALSARAVQRCRHRILLIRRCAGAAAGRRRVARPPSMGGGWRRAGGARQHRDRGGEAERQADLVAGVYKPRRLPRRSAAQQRRDVGLSRSAQERPSPRPSSWAEGQCQPSQDSMRHAHRRRAGAQEMTATNRARGVPDAQGTQAQARSR
jgi:hypothetical protein